ncbi:predicted protein [Nematostella vectensis]|uniref:Major facilitator superfamily (MFS) profile domain-containing protein n=2 Tax=Nematostella vectensis TaxID=45351 RepID=A7RNS4_NEMVE|nr:predicted protein [Nematostella vectensis]|eukprot:XP_001638965.1 predicted protein [Nematostella vectensis]
MTLYVYMLTFFAAIGGFLFGYDTGVVSGAMILISEVFHLSDFWHELIVSGTIGTAIVGAVLGGILNDSLGRKPVLVLCSGVFTAGAVVMGVAGTKHVLLVGRLVIGLGIGGASMTVPIYVAEAAPSSMRGKLVTLNNLFITGGQFIASVVDGIFAYDRQNGWRFMLGLAAVPSIIMFFGCVILPESPRWLISKCKYAEARAALCKIRGRTDVDRELEAVRRTCKVERKERSGQVLIRILRFPNTRRALLVGCMLQAIQQLCGINTVMYYSATIILMSGIGNSKTSIWLAAAIAFGNTLFTIVGIFLVERIGRRKLLLGSLAGVILSLFLLGGAFYLAMQHNPKVSTAETINPVFTHCTNQTTCMDCVNVRNCGYCYSTDSDGSILQGSCVYANTSTTKAWYGRCHTQSSQYSWRYIACPSKYAWMAFLGLVIYIATFAPGMGPMPWTLNSEMYPLWARSTGNACSTAVNWICNLVISMTFLSLMGWITRPGAFWLYGCIAVAGWVFFFVFVPETKGKTLEELDSLFVSRSEEHQAMDQ